MALPPYSADREWQKLISLRFEVKAWAAQQVLALAGDYPAHSITDQVLIRGGQYRARALEIRQSPIFDAVAALAAVDTNTPELDLGAEVDGMIQLATLIMQTAHGLTPADADDWLLQRKVSVDGVQTSRPMTPEATATLRSYLEMLAAGLS